jgi:hypothetical protein
MLFIIIAISPVLLIGIYDVPYADDFMYSINVRNAYLKGAGILDIIKAAAQTSMEFM